MDLRHWSSWHAHAMFMFIMHFHSRLQMLPKGSHKAFHKFLVLAKLPTAPSFSPLFSLHTHLIYYCSVSSIFFHFTSVLLSFSLYIFFKLSPEIVGLHISFHMFFVLVPFYSLISPIIPGLSFNKPFCPPVSQLTTFALPIICSLLPLTHSTTKGLFRISCLVPGFTLKSLDFAYWPSNNELSHQSSVYLSFITSHIPPIAPFSPADSLDIWQTLTFFQEYTKNFTLKCNEKTCSHTIHS